jgi:multicomponent Na+:H+ antiporter subunit E
VVHTLLLAGVLSGVWLLLSGHYAPLLLGIGALSVALVLLVANRMQVRDIDVLRYVVRGWGYWYWLTVEVVKSNLDVARCVLAGESAISPRLVRLKASQKTDLGKVTYANSITLTPGTVTVDVSGDELLVHALTREAAAALEAGEMDRRVRLLEGED